MNLKTKVRGVKFSVLGLRRKIASISEIKKSIQILPKNYLAAAALLRAVAISGTPESSLAVDFFSF